MYVYLYSNLIWSIAQPRLAVIFVTQYLFCVSSCPSCISCFVTSSMATPCSIFSYKLTKSPFLLTEWAIYQLVSTVMRALLTNVWTVHLRAITQPHKKQGERKIPRGHIWSFCSTFELSNLEEEAKVEYWGKGRQKSAEAVPAVCTVCTQKYA